MVASWVRNRKFFIGIEFYFQVGPNNTFLIFFVHFEYDTKLARRFSLGAKLWAWNFGARNTVSQKCTLAKQGNCKLSLEFQELNILEQGRHTNIK